MKMKNKHQEALNWLVYKMQYDRFYKLSEEQRMVILDIFTSGIALPTEPSKDYNYYFNLGINLNTISKNTIK